MTARVLTQAAVADLADVPATSRWVRSGDLRLHVLDYAVAGGPGVPLVVLPGITSPAVALDFVARELTDLVRPVVVDVRGRGFSDSGPSATLADYAADTAAVVAGLGLDRPILLGHSMGARIAAVCAAGGLAVRGTVLVDPPVNGTYPTPLSVFEDQLARARRGTTADEVAESWPRWPRREQELRARWLASCDAGAVAATHRGFETDDLLETWPAVPAPAVLVYGGASPVVTGPRAAELAARNPRAAVVAVPGAGHMVFWDEPEAALGMLRALLGRLLHSTPSPTGGDDDVARR